MFPECLDDWIDENNPVRAIDAFVYAVDPCELGFDGVVPEVTGRASGEWGFYSAQPQDAGRPGGDRGGRRKPAPPAALQS